MTSPVCSESERSVTRWRARPASALMVTPSYTDSESYNYSNYTSRHGRHRSQGCALRVSFFLKFFKCESHFHRNAINLLFLDVKEKTINFVVMVEILMVSS